MGFGFGLFFIIILIPLTGIMLLVWLITKNNAFGKLIGLIWFGVIWFDNFGNVEPLLYR